MASASRRAAAARWASWCSSWRSAERPTTSGRLVLAGGLVLGGSSAAAVASSYYYKYDDVSSSFSAPDPLLSSSREDDERSHQRRLDSGWEQDAADPAKNSAQKKKKHPNSIPADGSRADGAHPFFGSWHWCGAPTQLEGTAEAEARPPPWPHRPPRSSPSRRASSNNNQNDVLSYDFVVIGYGSAGRSAVETLQRSCPSASIALLDPWRCPPRRASSTASTWSVDYYAARAVGLQPGCRTVAIRDAKDDATVVVPRYLHYRHAVLIASGVRGAVPPNYLMEEPSRSHIYELRSTILPPPTRSSSSGMDDMENNSDEDAEEEEDDALAQPPPQRPVQSAEQVRTQIQQLAQRGATIGVVGSGFEALDVVVMAAAQVARGSHHRRRVARPILIFGSHGPASHTLPQYLSKAVSRKLKSQQIVVLDRSLIRYIAHNHDAAHSVNHEHENNNPSPPLASSSNAKLHVYTAKSFDFLDGQTTAVDALVLCPDTSGPRGTAAVPTADVPACLRQSSSARCWYQTWSTLSVDGPQDDSDNDNSNDWTTRLGCYRDDGRIAVHPELAACHGVYAAGSVAKYANPWTGNATVAGGGATAGRTAAHNMAQLYYDYHSSSSSSSSTVWQRGWSLRGDAVNGSGTTMMMVMDPIPIWRSDERYSSTSPDGTEPTSLSDIGITALCVGNCEAESMATHGVWWSNLSAVQRRRTQRAFTADSGTSTNTESHEDNEDRRQKQRRREIKKSLKPVYGIGVVYYLDRTGRIQGVMTWGLPFTESEHSTQLNHTLVEQIKTVIRTNGGLRRRWLPHANTSNSNSHNFESVDYSIKMAHYLRDTSEQLLRTALESHGEAFSRAHQLGHNKFPRPLHRFTEVRPPSLRSVSVLKRQDGLHGHGVLGEDMFCRAFVGPDDHQDPPPEVVPADAVVVVGSAVEEKARHEAQYRQWTAWEQVERRWDENEARARPPKEEALWIRKGDETRNIPHRERIANAYRTAMGR